MTLPKALSAAAVIVAAPAFADLPRPKEAPKPQPAATGPATTSAKPPAEKALTVGLTSALNDQKSMEQAAAFAGWVRGSTNQPVKEQIFTDYEQLAQAVAKGEVDVALMGPLAYLRIPPKTKAPLLGRMIRKGAPTYRAVLFARQGSALKSLENLRKAKNLKVGWVDPSSTTGYILPKAQLLQNGIDPVQIFVDQDFAGTHEAVCKGVAEGKWDLGATFADGAAPTPAHAIGCVGVLGPKADTLTIVSTTVDVPNDVLVASPTLSQELVDKLGAEALRLAGTEPGKKLLKAAFLSEGVTAVTDADFEPVRKAVDAFKK